MKPNHSSSAPPSAPQNIESQVPPNFECRRCGNCCQISGEVRVGRKEIKTIAYHLRMSETDFIERYTRLTKDRFGLSLIDGEEDRCIFLDSQNRCAINQVKPEQCRSFPYKWRYADLQKICQGCQ